jgi:hypothetical protein
MAKFVDIDVAPVLIIILIVEHEDAVQDVSYFEWQKKNGPGARRQSLHGRQLYHFGRSPKPCLAVQERGRMRALCCCGWYRSRHLSERDWQNKKRSVYV